MVGIVALSRAWRVPEYRYACSNHQSKHKHRKLAVNGRLCGAERSYDHRRAQLIHIKSASIKWSALCPDRTVGFRLCGLGAHSMPTSTPCKHNHEVQLYHDILAIT